jgi:hypothetical protein
MQTALSYSGALCGIERILRLHVQNNYLRGEISVLAIRNSCKFAMERSIILLFLFLLALTSF